MTHSSFDLQAWGTSELIEEVLRLQAAQPKFLAVVPTAYEIYAVGSTETEAQSRALGAALEWLQMGATEFEHNSPYETVDQVYEWLGCNVYPLSDLGVGQEG